MKNQITFILVVTLTANIYVCQNSQVQALSGNIQPQVQPVLQTIAAPVNHNQQSQNQVPTTAQLSQAQQAANSQQNQSNQTWGGENPWVSNPSLTSGIIAGIRSLKNAGLYVSGQESLGKGNQYFLDVTTGYFYTLPQLNIIFNKNNEDIYARQQAEQMQREEELRRQEAEQLARQQAEEAARRQAEEEARRQAEEEARRQAEEEARRQADELAHQQAEEELRRQQAEQLARQQAEEEAKRQAEEQARQQQNSQQQPSQQNTQNNQQNNQPNRNNNNANNQRFPFRQQIRTGFNLGNYQNNNPLRLVYFFGRNN